MYYVSLNLFSDLTIVFSQGALRSGVAAVLRCVLPLPLCHGLACRSCRDGQLLLEEQK